MGYAEHYDAERREREQKRKKDSIKKYNDITESIEILDMFVGNHSQSDNLEISFTNFKNAIIAWRYKMGHFKEDNEDV